jgi:chaperonin cofactor prefoldin
MADEQEREEYLQKQIDDLDEQIKELAEKMEEEMGISCEFGSCVFDPSLDSIELKIEEVQRRKKMLEAMHKSLKEC